MHIFSNCKSGGGVVGFFCSIDVFPKEIIDSTTSKQPEPQHQTTKTASQAQLIKMQESLDKLISKVTLLEVNLNISNNSKSKSHAQTSSSSGVLQSKVSEDLDMLGKEIKSQLDDVHDMVASMEEKHGGLLEGIKNDLSVHDKHTGVSFNKIALVMRDILDNSKQVGTHLFCLIQTFKTICV